MGNMTPPTIATCRVGMDWLTWILISIVLVCSVLLGWLFKTNVQPDLRLFDEEKFFFTADNKKIPFPPIFSSEPLDSIQISFVVPSYNEEKRLDAMMTETMDYCTNRATKNPKFIFEVIIVSDGSTDKTVQTGQQWVIKYPDNVRVMNLIKNRGKGGAVKRGIMVSRGSIILIVDADGATKFSDLEKVEAGLRKVVKNGHGISIGSRAHLQGQAEAKRSFFRNLLTWGFHFVVTFIGGVKGIRDTQCGFKLFTRPTANLLFPGLHIERWAFDVELLWLAQQTNVPVEEVHVAWTEIAGSHLEEEDTRIVSIGMFFDLLRVRLSYLIGLWARPRVKVC